MNTQKMLNKRTVKKVYETIQKKRNKVSKSIKSFNLTRSNNESSQNKPQSAINDMKKYYNYMRKIVYEKIHSVTYPEDK